MSARPQLPYSDSLRLLLAQSLDLGRSRIDLLLFELVDERSRLGRLLQYSLSMALLALLSVQLLVLLIVAATWDSDWRLAVIALLASLALLATAAMLRAWRRVPVSTLFEVRRTDAPVASANDGPVAPP